MTNLATRNLGLSLLCLLGLGSIFPAAALGQDTMSPTELDSPHSDIVSEDDSQDKVYTSPQSILANFFGRRRAGMVVNGLEDLVGITATGLSPLLVLSVVSPVVYFLTEPGQRAELIFLYQPWFFIPIIIVTAVVAFKDTVLTFASYLKMPLDILGILFHVIGFFLGFRLIYHLLDIHVGAEGGPLGTVLAIGIVVLMFAFYTSIWVMSNVFEVLILINPFPLVDTFLRVGRISILLCMYVACWIHPALGGIIALPILIVSLITFERSLRTTLLGFRLIYDVVLFRTDLIADNSTQLTAFATFAGNLPWMTLGSLVKKDEGWFFSYRRFCVGPSHCIPIEDGPYAIAKGSLFPGLMKQLETGSQLIVRFPASYRGQEDALSKAFQTDDIHDFRWSTMAKSAWSTVVKAFFRRSPKQPPMSLPAPNQPSENPSATEQPQA